MQLLEALLRYDLLYLFDFRIVGRNILDDVGDDLLRNEIVADTTQLFNPVKNADQNIFIHCTIYHIAYNLIALVVNANNSAS